MPQMISGVILAGGNSRRMGRDKAWLDFNGQPLIAVIAERLRTVVDEVIIAADDTKRFTPFADCCVPDAYRGIGTLSGIHAGLQAASHDPILIVGCDMPFLDPRVLAWLVKESQEVDLVVIKHELGLEPLHAVYRKSCLPAVEATIRSGERCAFAFCDQIRVRFVHPSEIPSLHPDRSSFFNVNTPEQWREALIQVQAACETLPARGPT